VAEPLNVHAPCQLYPRLSLFSKVQKCEATDHPTLQEYPSSSPCPPPALQRLAPDTTQKHVFAVCSHTFTCIYIYVRIDIDIRGVSHPNHHPLRRPCFLRAQRQASQVRLRQGYPPESNEDEKVSDEKHVMNESAKPKTGRVTRTPIHDNGNHRAWYRPTALTPSPDCQRLLPPLPYPSFHQAPGNNKNTMHIALSIWMRPPPCPPALPSPPLRDEVQTLNNIEDRDVHINSKETATKRGTPPQPFLPPTSPSMAKQRRTNWGPGQQWQNMYLQLASI